MRLMGMVAPVLALCVAACGSIDQVPLVYVSTVKIGVNASSGTAETPGAKLSIGYDGTDAAYVPIVAGRCPKDGAEACDITKLLEIGGSNNVSPADFIRDARARSEELAKLVEAVGKAQTQYASAVTSKASADQALAVAAASKAALGKLGAAPVADENGVTAEDPVKDLRVRLYEESDDIETKQAVVTERQNNVRLAEQALDAAQRDLASARGALATMLSAGPSSLGTRDDALSVFGSFDADTSANTGGSNGVGLALGKAFSTGIAAQLLTEGIRDAAHSRAGAQCVDSALAAATDPAAKTVDQEILKLALAACAVPERTKLPGS